MLIEDVLKEFIFDCEIRNLSERTIKGYKNNCSKFFLYTSEEYKKVDLEDITHQHIKKYFKYLLGNGLSESYVNSILKNLRAFFKYCVNEEYIIKNPCLKVSWLKEKKVIIKTFTNEEIIGMVNVFNFSNYLNARNKTLLITLIETGIRNTELCNIQISDVKEKYIIIQGKGNKERYVPITPILKKYMIKYERIKSYYFKDKFIKGDNYFLSRTGRPLTKEAIERIVKLAGEESNIRKEIRCSPHTIRHYYSQTQLKNGLDVYSLSRVLGHEKISITRRYLQSINDKDIVEQSVKYSPLMSLKM